MEKEENPYIDENYVLYQDDRWMSIPGTTAIGYSELTEEQKEKAKEFEDFINNDKKDKQDKNFLNDL